MVTFVATSHIVLVSLVLTPPSGVFSIPTWSLIVGHEVGMGIGIEPQSVEMELELESKMSELSDHC